MTTREIITACATKAKLPFLIIGGHAVIAHGYARTTVDLDFLISKADRGAWLSWFLTLGYQPSLEHENFAQLRSSAGGVDVDLMLVPSATFAAMQAASAPAALGGVNARVPSLEHLLALKLHVLKQNLRHRTLRDLDDVINLVSVNGLNLLEDHWKALFQRYGDAGLYAKVLQATTP